MLCCKFRTNKGYNTIGVHSQKGVLCERKEETIHNYVNYKVIRRRKNNSRGKLETDFKNTEDTRNGNSMSKFRDKKLEQIG